MLDALGVDFSLLPRHADRKEKREHRFVSIAHPPRQPPTPGRQRDGFVRLGLDQLLALEPGDDARHRHMADAHHPGEITNTRFAGFIQQLRDRLDIILRGFIAVRGSSRTITVGGISGGGSWHGALHLRDESAMIHPNTLRDDGPADTIAE